MLLGLNHADLLAAGFLPVSAASLLSFIRLLGPFRALPLFQLRAQLCPGQFAISRLRALPLASRLDAGRTMTQPHTGTRLLQLLPAVTRAEDESFIHVRGPHPESRQSDFNCLVHRWRSDGGTETVGIDLDILIFCPPGPEPRTKLSITCRLLSPRAANLASTAWFMESGGSRGTKRRDSGRTMRAAGLPKRNPSPVAPPDQPYRNRGRLEARAGATGNPFIFPGLSRPLGSASCLSETWAADPLPRPPSSR